MTVRFTKYKIDNLKAKPIPYKVWDSQGNGLHIRIQPSGTKTWRVKYRMFGKEKAVTLGRYPDITIAEARLQSLKEKLQVKEGIDVSHEKKLEKQIINLPEVEDDLISFKNICINWAEQKSKENKVKGGEALNRFKKYVFPMFKDTPIKRIKTHMLEELCLEIRNEYGFFETARKVRQDFINVYKFAVKREHMENNIARDIDLIKRIKEVESHPAITDKRKTEDFGKVISLLNRNNEDIVLSTAIRLLPHVFARPSELRRMRWNDIDFTNAEWTYQMTKITNGFTQKIDRLVPLSPQVLEMLRGLYTVTKDFDFCFPANTKTGYINKKHLSDSVDRAGVDRSIQSIHGYRASFRTYADEVLGFRPEICRQQLGHKVYDKNGVAYNRTLFLDERVDMMNQWSNWLEDLSNKVVENCFVKRRTTTNKR